MFDGIPRLIGGMKSPSRLLKSGSVLVCLSFLFVLGFGGLNTVQAANVSTSFAVPQGSGLPFAIADFDGDQRPDIASIQASQGPSASSEEYWVRLRLSAAGKSYLHLTAPRGGLQVEARDVNGDHAVDLVLSTAWFDRPVAIFLNDGHGNFSRVDLSAFPQAFSKAHVTWNTSTARYPCVLGLSQESSFGELARSRAAESLKRGAVPSHFARAQLLRAPFLIHIAGRAPPAALLL